MEPVNAKAGLLGRVRASLRGRAGAHGAETGSVRLRSAPASGRERIVLFRRRFEEAGGTFLSGPSAEAVLAPLAETLRMAGVTALLFPDDDPGAAALAGALVPYGPFLIVPAAEARQPLPPVTAGVQTADLAVAETGTIVQTGLGGKTLLPGLLPDVHVALLSPGIVAADLEECLEALSADPPRNISLITGPSRTADIELTLTVGVHGPGVVIAVLTNPP